jgi:hypothetical protein
MSETKSPTPDTPKTEPAVLEYVMPEVPVGGVVLFKKGLGPSQKTYPATVREKKNRTLNLVVQGSNAGKSGVRHESDPWFKKRPEAVNEFGCWVETHSEARLVDLEKVVLGLVKDVADLKAAVANRNVAVNTNGNTYKPKG